jgi:hypothetical protein
MNFRFLPTYPVSVGGIKPVGRLPPVSAQALKQKAIAYVRFGSKADKPQINVGYPRANIISKVQSARVGLPSHACDDFMKSWRKH